MHGSYGLMTLEAGRDIPPVLKLHPVGKDYLWGGHRLKEEFGKRFDMDPVAESWECSTHPDGMSTALGSACTLKELLLEHPGFLGTHPAQSMPDAAARGELPILVKFIDAARDLSIQVHPDDAYACEHENGQLGKTEMWYVLDAAPGANLIFGFRRDMDRAGVLKAIEADRLETILQKVPVRKDDVFFVRSGTVHAIGAGCLIIEVQESSNLTYRLFDYHRKGADGKERTLHISKALDVLNYWASSSPRQPMRTLRYRPGCARELLCRCRYFEVHRMLIHTQCTAMPVPYQTDATSFHVLVCIDGSGVISCENGTDLPVFRGETLFIPASTRGLGVKGTAAFLDVNC